MVSPPRPAAPWRASRPRLYVLSPMAPQRNGLADYLSAYLPWLAAEQDVLLVAPESVRAAVAAAHAGLPGVQVIGEAEFLARQPDPDGLVLYNLGNNTDCLYLLDHLQACPGAVVVHDISLFYLHQEAARQAGVDELMGGWLADDGHPVPDEFLRADGRIERSPTLLYAECLMLRRIARSARGLLVHTRYAERRLRGAVPDLGARPLARVPHFVEPPPAVSEVQRRTVEARFGIGPQDRLMLVPGFLTGNKMLYELLAAFRSVQAGAPGLRLLFAGEEREAEYALSRRIAQWWPDGSGPQVTGYLEAADLDALLDRADLSFVLRYPTYGESSGMLPRAALGGGRVVTVDIGAYPEFISPRVSTVSVGPGLAEALADTMRALAAEPPVDPERRERLRQDEAQRQQALSLAALAPQWQSWLQACRAATTEGAV